MNKSILAGVATTIIVTGLTGLRVGAAQSQADDAKSVQMFRMWTGVPSDDEQVGKYDTNTGLGTFVDCSDQPNDSGRHELRVQFSYSQTTRTVPFYADIIPDGTGHPDPKFHSVLDADHPSVTYTTQIRDCDEKYSLYVGYPKPMH